MSYNRACQKGHGLEPPGAGNADSDRTMERRISAIVAADVVGFSRLLRRDEDATLAELKELFAVMQQLVEERHGRVFGGAGDSLLAEFSSPVQAVDCALELQKTIGQRNTGPSDDQQMLLRIGINMGEVMVSGGDLVGNSVNLAARIEGLADPGGVAISETVHRHLSNGMSAMFEDMGEHRVRGFPEPVRTFRASPGELGQGERPPMPAAGFAETGSRIIAARPIFVVLPFSNLSGDAQQEYFCHGLTNDLTTELSKFSSLSVVSSTTALAYKSGQVSIQTARRDLDARYVLEGSVQKTADRIRINVQLIETVNDNHLWAKRFDRDTADVLVLQDEIIENVVAALALKVEAEERERAMRKATVNLSAYDAFLKGSYLWLQHSNTDESKKTMLNARKWLVEATTLDPNYARAWAWLSLTYIQEWLRSWGGKSALDQAGRLVKKAIMIDASDYHIHWVLAYYDLNSRNFDLALSEYEVAVSLNPNDANLLAEFAEAQVYVGDLDKGLELTRLALRMNPNMFDWYRVDIAWMRYLKREYAAAIDEINRLAMPNADAQFILAAAQAQVASRRAAENQAELSGLAQALAREALRNALARIPRWTINKEQRRSPFRRPEDLEHWLSGLRMAGLPQ